MLRGKKKFFNENSILSKVLETLLAFIFFIIPFISSLKLMYFSLTINFPKNLESEPTFFPIDISLSFKITIIFFNLFPPILLRASKE